MDQGAILSKDLTKVFKDHQSKEKPSKQAESIQGRPSLDNS